MANLSRIETATTADWRFTEDADLMTACEIAARRVAEAFEAVEYEDALQDAYLWLAVRPSLQARYRDGEFRGVPHFAERIYVNGLRPNAVADSEERKLRTALDPALDAEVI